MSWRNLKAITICGHDGKSHMGKNQSKAVVGRMENTLVGLIC